MPDSSSLLQISHFSKNFRDFPALSNVSFSINQGEILGLIGPNGSGKTTLLEGIAGFLPLNSGAVSYLGSTLKDNKRRNHLFYLPDGITPYKDMHVSFALQFFSSHFNASEHTFNRIVTNLKLTSVLSKKVKHLSKGFTKRYLLAIALLSNQPLLILDEPFDGLDLHQSLGVMKILQKECKSGRTLLLSIHQLSDAERICSRFLLLDSGKIVGTGTIEELRKQASLPGGTLEEVFLALT